MAQPLTRTMKIPVVKNTLSSLVNAVYRKETRVLVEKAGIPIAALVSVDDLARLDQLDKAWDKGTRALERFTEAFSDIPVDELEAEIGRIAAEGRTQNEAERKSA